MTARRNNNDDDTRALQVVVDAADPPMLASFWSTALGWTATNQQPEDAVIAPPADDPGQAGQLPMRFVRDATPKSVKNRIHLDLASRSENHQAALVARLEALGARQVDLGQRSVSWVVMADPEDNEFCVVSHRGSVGKDPASAFGDLSPVAAIVFDCADPEAIAPFWAAATGWAALGQDDQGVWLRDVSTSGPYLDLHRVVEPKTGPLRVRIDIAPAAGDDPAAALERIVAMGAREIAAAQPGTGRRLVDSEGNEFTFSSASQRGANVVRR